MRAFLLSAIVFTLVFAAGAPSGARTQTSEAKIYGYFTIAGKVPAAFKNIEIMDIEYPAYVDSTKPGKPDYGSITVKGRRPTDYHLLEPTLDGKNISFKTKTVRGVHYEFSGTLIRLNFDNPQPNDEIALRGTLKKFQGAKAIATADVAYNWQLGD